MLVLRERGVCLDSSLVFVLLLLLGGQKVERISVPFLMTNSDSIL